MNDVTDPAARFEFEHKVRAPRERVFKLWTTLEHLQRWFGPTGVTIPEASLDIRPGGRFHYCMRLQDGSSMWGKWRFEEIQFPRRIVTTVAFSDPAGNDARAPWDPEWPLHTHSDISFHEEGDQTLIRIEWAPHQASEAESRRFAEGLDSMRQGWAGTMARLDDYLATEAGAAMSITPYLNLNGHCAEALAFYAEKLAAKTGMVMKFAESPMAEQTPPEWRDKVMHASFTVDGSTVMASDGMPGGNEQIAGISLSIAPADVEAAERIFSALSEGGTVKMPLQETFWARRFGMLTDKFGVPWMVNAGEKM